MSNQRHQGPVRLELATDAFQKPMPCPQAPPLLAFPSLIRVMPLVRLGRSIPASGCPWVAYGRSHHMKKVEEEHFVRSKKMPEEG